MKQFLFHVRLIGIEPIRVRAELAARNPCSYLCPPPKEERRRK